jgi:hypothetical protein
MWRSAFEDEQPGRTVATGWQMCGWIARETIPVRLPPWFEPQGKLVVREYAATGRVTVALEGITVE